MNPPLNSVKLRLATPADTERVLEIYAPYIENTSITFEVEVPTIDVFAKRMASAAETYPYIVAEITDGAAADTGDAAGTGGVAGRTIIGYAYAHACGEKAAYGWNAELTVYLDQRFRAKGCGRMLCEALLGVLTAQGMRNVFSLITEPNEASFRLHETLGFERIGLQKHAGYKCGSWHDVAWLQKSLGDFSNEPPAPIPASALNATLVAATFERIEYEAEQRSAAYSSLRPTTRKNG